MVLVDGNWMDELMLLMVGYDASKSLEMPNVGSNFSGHYQGYGVILWCYQLLHFCFCPLSAGSGDCKTYTASYLHVSNNVYTSDSL